MVDYWKNVPGIDGDNTGHTMDEKSGDAKNYLKRDVIKQMIKSGKWEVDSGDADGKSGSSLIMRSHTGKKRAVIIESAIDSDHLQNSLNALIDDFKSGPAEEKKIVSALKWVRDRINQSIPDGDVKDADIEDFLKEPSGRKMLKKSGMKSAEMVSMIMDF